MATLFLFFISHGPVKTQSVCTCGSLGTAAPMGPWVAPGRREGGLGDPMPPLPRLVVSSTNQQTEFYRALKSIMIAKHCKYALNIFNLQKYLPDKYLYYPCFYKGEKQELGRQSHVVELTKLQVAALRVWFQSSLYYELREK